jgi:hypothetical protein
VIDFRGMRLAIAVTLAIAGWAFAGDKNGIRVTQENDGLSVTVSTKKEKGIGTFQPGASTTFAMVYVRVQNTTDKPLAVDLSKFYLRTSAGQALRTITLKEAMGTLPVLAKVLVDRETRRDIAESATVRIFPDSVPPQTFAEGMVLFRGTGDAGSQKLPVTLHLPGLLKDPIPINW